MSELGLAHHLRAPLTTVLGARRQLEVLTFVHDEPVDAALLEPAGPGIVLGTEPTDPTLPRTFSTSGDGPRLEPRDGGWVLLPSFDMVGLLDSIANGQPVRRAISGETRLHPGERVIIELGPVTYLISDVSPSRRVPGLPVHFDAPMLAILGFVGLTASIFGYALAVVPPAPDVSGLNLEDQAVLVDLMKLKPPVATGVAKTAGVGAAKGAEGAARKGQPKPQGRPGQRPEGQRLLAGLGAVFAEIGASELPGGVRDGVEGLQGRPTGRGPGLNARGPGLGGGGQTDSVGWDRTSLLEGIDVGPPGGPPKKDGAIATTGEITLLGSLDSALVDRIIKQNLASIRHCYQKELQVNPGLGGKVTVKFTIAADGTVSTANTRATSSMPKVESCIQGRFLRMKFPEPKGGGVVIVNYPFVFSAS